jgi:hypothetical protein
LNDFSFTPTKQERWDLELRNLPQIMGNPIPASMQDVRLEDLAAVPIHWKMLRFKTHQQERGRTF